MRARELQLLAHLEVVLLVASDGEALAPQQQDVIFKDKAALRPLGSVIVATLNISVLSTSDL